MYRRRGKICWAEYLQFQRYQSFHRNTFTLPSHKCPLFSTIKERRLNSRKNFHDAPENREKCESLAQQIFPRWRYMVFLNQLSQFVIGAWSIAFKVLVQLECN